ncbi:MAG: hydrogenase maturation protease [Gammaproteobacteria bacterium]
MSGHAPPRFDAGTLLFGIGNSGRGDDGLGWAFVDAVRGQADFAAQAEYRYQLQVEDALLVSRFARVVIVDASAEELPGGYRWAPCAARAADEFTSHVLTPSAVLHYAAALYGATPRAGLLAIGGCRWELGAGLSATARHNLARALAFCGAPMGA